MAVGFWEFWGFMFQALEQRQSNSFLWDFEEVSPDHLRSSGFRI